MPHLFDPITVKDITLRNRIGVSPMCQYSYQGGFSNDWQVVHLGSRAVGGAGLVMTEATAVEARGRITPFDAGIWLDAHIEPLSRVARAIKSNGAIPGIQIAHAGRKACTGKPWEGGKPVKPGDPNWWQAAGPSPVAFKEGYQIPLELSVGDIKKIQLLFAAAAERSLQAGFEWLEVHAAHGYLLQSFLSPLSNQRTNAYGGSFENRTRFTIETVREVRRVWPERLPLAVRISGTEWIAGGWDVGDSVELAKLLKQEGVDLIDCSSAGNIAGVAIPTEEGYQVHIAENVRKGAEIATAAVGLITRPQYAEHIVSSGQADIVLVGREMLRNPYWAIKAARELEQSLPVPPQYLRAY